MKNTLTPAARVTIGLLSLAVTLLLFMDLVLGVFPSHEQQRLQTRQRMAESIAVQLTTMIAQNDLRTVPAVINELLRREPELRSIGLRSTSGQLVASTAEHLKRWNLQQRDEIGRSRFIVPIATSTARDGRWGQIEFAFQPIPTLSWRNLLGSPSIQLIALFGLSAGIMYYIYLRRSFQHLDPASAVPERVQMAFDALSEAVLVLDDHLRIVMANDTFIKLANTDRAALLGKDPSDFDWLHLDLRNEDLQAPWHACVQKKHVIQGVTYQARTLAETRHLVCNCSPVFDARETVRGCMVSFSDVTDLDEANSRLVMLMTELSLSKEQLQLQNLELQRLASCDPMTGALNRRAFFPVLEHHFQQRREQGLPLSFVMCDIDKFKSINDVFGHPVGDKVIQKFASIILRLVSDRDVVCRYGGEEFCIALPGTGLDAALQFAEHIRATVEAEIGLSLQLEGRPLITASFGVSSLSLQPESPAQLIEQADQALYCSKHKGRNQCTVFAPELAGLQETERASAAPAATDSLAQH
jgi:diguanylate cyclase (GGDEF)-like protein